MRLYERFLPRTEKRSTAPGLSWDDYVSWFAFDGHQHPAMSWGRPKNPKTETPPNDFTTYAETLYKRNGIVGACINIRLAVFSQTWPMWQRLEQGRPGDLFSTAELDLLREPWPNGTSAELLARMIQDVDLAGNFYAHREGRSLSRLRPDWVDIVLDRPGSEPHARVLGYVYRPDNDAKKAVQFPVEQVVHWSPLPDPTAQFRGMTWLTPVVREVMSDGKMTDHKGRFLDNAATPNLVVKYPQMSPEDFKEVTDIIDQGHSGTVNAYKTLHLAGGADVTVVGRDFQQLDFKVVQGAGETRIAAAAGVPPTIVGFSEGLLGSSLNAGNYAMARRRFADGTMHPLWGSAFGALQKVLRPAPATRLWHDPSMVPFLREDVKDQAEITAIQARSIRELVDAGYDPDASVRAVTQHDPRLLVSQHSGLFSVQLQPAGVEQGARALPAPQRALPAVTADIEEAP